MTPLHTHAVPAAVERSPSVRRVVLTSSVAAVMCSTPAKCRPGVHRYDESDWNGLASESVLPYCYSKTAAERKAWELAGKQDRWTLVTLCPSLVLGPPLSGRTDSESVALIRRMVGGEMYPAAPYGGISTVDVRDVAAAHCLAMLHPAAKGRRTILQYTLYTLGYVNVMDSGKVQRELGLRFTPLAVTMRDMIEDLAARGIVRHPKPSAAIAGVAAAQRGGS
ncbi:NADPH-dependent aldehyde reductase ARI1 [Tetrabaena socialis]|uniref:NADPH-dependent aldehyde reductase ARI1 n=1 Tax=Tetrabaena socialis TaxID=47790 RepID=A0A2J7ZMP1_9CHLO|nr:NADPH-dependent aldehyde reductase ARI1 [Tetrabaena socialis]|eukprot:PNH01520.1 NADPH-dependent aldehyde reductase ARI1 [Tetrabaena socialis]